MTEAETVTTANDKIIPNNICYTFNLDALFALIDRFCSFILHKSHLFALKGGNVTEKVCCHLPGSAVITKITTFGALDKS